MSSNNGEGLDPERHLKRLQKVFKVTRRLQEIAEARIQHDASSEAKAQEAEAFARAKKRRQERICSLDPVHIGIIEMTAELLNISVDEAKDGIADSDEHVRILKNLSVANGIKALVFSYGLNDHPSKDSGRFDPKSRYSKMMRLICATGNSTIRDTAAVAVYRLSADRQIDLKNIGNDLYFSPLVMNDGESVLATLLKTLDNINVSSCESYAVYGLSKPMDKESFHHQLKASVNFLQSTEDILNRITIFDIYDGLYKGRLLVKYQIEGSSRNKDIVRAAEEYFLKWMNQIRLALIQGKQITKQPKSCYFFVL